MLSVRNVIYQAHSCVPCSRAIAGWAISGFMTTSTFTNFGHVLPLSIFFELQVCKNFQLQFRYHKGTWGNNVGGNRSGSVCACVSKSKLWNDDESILCTFESSKSQQWVGAESTSGTFESSKSQLGESREHRLHVYQKQRYSSVFSSLWFQNRSFYLTAFCTFSCWQNAAGPVVLKSPCSRATLQKPFFDFYSRSHFLNL